MDERSPASSLPASPCVGICLLDPVTRQCRGCLRTVDEIARWYDSSIDEKRALLAVLDGRRAAAGGRRHEQK
ncbi:MAG TPA: DUF1289 domain-containing protein [Stellaceae bacterium]|nr:DUF1289 domain-containing protein [Stellaceae bacterium]